MKRKLFLLLCALLTSVGMWAYQTPVADGIYYLYNTGVTDGNTGFICRGENYAQQAVIDRYGIPFKLISTGSDDTYYFQLYDTDLWLSDDGFMYTDGGTDRRRAIRVELQGDGIYKLINTNNNKEVENWYGHPVGDGEGNRRDYLWQFLSVAEYEAVVAGYTATDKSNIASTMGWDLSGTDFNSYLSTNYVGVDKTSLIQHATFDTSHNTAGWTVTANEHSSMAIAWGNESGDKITPEVYQGYGTISQTVTVPNAGLYKVTVNSFARNANYERFHNAGAVSSVSYLKANDNKVRLCDIYSNGEVTSNFPSGPNDANTRFFSKGNYLNEVYVYVTDESKQITITLCNPSATGGCWMVFDNFKLTYYSDEVSEEDATEILSQATELESKAMLASVKSALTSAKTTFDGARTIANYNALSSAIDAANASITAYAPLGTKLAEAATVKSDVSSYAPSYVTTFDTNIAVITSDYNDGNYAESEISTQVAAVETEIVKLVKSQTESGADMTRAVPNAACNAAAGSDNWKIQNTLASGEYFRLDTWAGTASGMSVPMIEYWIANGNTLSSNVIYQTISGLQNGLYTVTATTAVNNEAKVVPSEGSALLFANDATKDIATGGTETEHEGQTGTFSLSVILTDADEGNLTLGIKTVTPNYNWIAFKDVKLAYYGSVADADDYAALNDAISAVSSNVAGFETGEYAPYNNVEAFAALAAAEAIDQAAVNPKLVVQDATAALKSATWTANVAEVNAFYKGDFNGYAEDTTTPLDYTPNGWTPTDNFRLMLANTTTYPGLSDASATRAVMAWSGGIAYGEQAGYEMPLAAHTIYELQFKAAGWDGQTRGNLTVNVKKGSEGMVSMNLGAADKDIAGKNADAGLTSFSVYFVTGEAGNYVFSISSPNNMVLTDFDLRKAASQTLTFADDAAKPTYAPGTYPNVSVERAMTGGKWYTLVIPVNMAIPSGWTVKEMDSFDEDILSFTDASSIEAGKPYMVKTSSDVENIVVSNTEVAALNLVNNTQGNMTMKGVYYDITTVPESDENNVRYIVSGNELHKVTSAVSIKPFRAYFELVGETAAREIILNLDDATMINAVEAADAEAEGGLKDGKYLIGNKIVLVKNGVKYSANGQKLN